MAKSNKGSLKNCIAYIGCGEYPMQGAINIDIRKLPGVDIVADAKKLPFKNAEIGGIASRNIIEHFDRFEIKEVIKEWNRVIKKGGFVSFETVDMGTAMDVWRDIPRENLLDCMYGAQTYPENFHKMLITEDIMDELFKEVKMKKVKVERFIHREIPRIKLWYVK